MDLKWNVIKDEIRMLENPDFKLTESYLRNTSEIYLNLAFSSIQNGYLRTASECTYLVKVLILKLSKNYPWSIAVYSLELRHRDLCRAVANAIAEEGLENVFGTELTSKDL